MGLEPTTSSLGNRLSVDNKELTRSQSTITVIGDYLVSII